MGSNLPSVFFLGAFLAAFLLGGLRGWLGGGGYVDGGGVSWWVAALRYATGFLSPLAFFR